MLISLIPIDWLPAGARSALVVPYVLIAALVTIDALLRKRDVRAALGWIGVAWLSPVIGGLLYYIFGINRVTRRALKLSRPEETNAGHADAQTKPDVQDNIAALAEASLRITGNALTAGNRITLLEGGAQTYPAMLEAIGQAQQTIAFSSYIFRYDRSGRAFVDALIAAQRRGVAVRVLLDGIGSGYVYSAAAHMLARAGVPVTRFLHTWIPWRMPFLNMRNHKKLLVVDGHTGFTGGLNIGKEYDSERQRKGSVRDVHTRIEGPVVRQLMESFARDWYFTTDESLDDAAWWPTIPATGPVFARGVSSGPDADIYKVEAMLGAALAQARKRVRIVTPYFLPDQRLEFAIAQAGLRGVTIEIVLPERCDYRVLDWAMRAHLRFCERMPAQVHFSPRPFDHAKLMTVDGEWCLFGSSNWDARSLRLNFEFDVECYGRETAAEIDRLIDARIAQSRAVTRADLLGAPRWAQLRDAAVRLFLPYL